MSKFPLYDRISKDITDTDLSKSQKELFIKRINRMDTEGHELTYALIRMYQVENNEENTSFTLPYSGIYSGNDVVFDIDKLPNKLTQILFKFLYIHIKKMNEETKLEKLTDVQRIVKV